MHINYCKPVRSAVGIWPPLLTVKTGVQKEWFFEIRIWCYHLKKAVQSCIISIPRLYANFHQLLSIVLRIGLLCGQCKDLQYIGIKSDLSDQQTKSHQHGFSIAGSNRGRPADVNQRLDMGRWVL